MYVKVEGIVEYNIWDKYDSERKSPERSGESKHWFFWDFFRIIIDMENLIFNFVLSKLN